MSQPQASILPGGTMTFLATPGHPVGAFAVAADAVREALDRRTKLGSEVRLAVHTGEAHIRHDGQYLGPALRTCERLAEIAHARQTLLSSATALTVADALPDGCALVDLGLHRLRDLSSPMRVFALEPRDRAGEALPLRSLDRVPNNLPVYLTTFVGRQSELAAVRGLLRGQRLVTIAGPGGSGKSRLAAQVAADLIEQWPDGVWWVELGSVASSSPVASAVADGVAALIEPRQGPLRSLSVQLRERRVLICLDSCEHVLDGVAELADGLLRACPEVSLLVTSREPLDVAGESVWRVPPLGDEDALALFVERASIVRPWFTLDSSSEAAVRTMCARLDGIPLALELAAAWQRTLTPRQIEAGLDNRFALLVRGPRGAAPRQQTLAASIDWSHALLDETDRVVFRRLAVLPGGFDLAAAESVASAPPVGRDDILDAIARLVDKSLVVAEERAGQTRYRLLETMREYALERLTETGEVDAARDRHLDHFLRLAEILEPALQRDLDAWRAQIELEHDNLRAALEWGLTAADAERGRRLAALLPWLWHLHGHGNEGIAFLRRAIERAPDDRSTLQARLLTGIALVADTASPLDLEYDAAQRALAIATEQGEQRLRALSRTGGCRAVLHGFRPRVAADRRDVHRRRGVRRALRRRCRPRAAGHHPAPARPALRRG
jgi:predicted ATPase